MCMDVWVGFEFFGCWVLVFLGCGICPNGLWDSEISRRGLCCEFLFFFLRMLCSNRTRPLLWILQVSSFFYSLQVAVPAVFDIPFNGVTTSVCRRVGCVLHLPNSSFFGFPKLHTRGIFLRNLFFHFFNIFLGPHKLPPRLPFIPEIPIFKKFDSHYQATNVYC